jgi:hypothetical protein
MIKDKRLVFVERPPRQSNATKVVPYCAYWFRVPNLLMPVHKLDRLVKFHFPTWRNVYLRRKVLAMVRQDKMNFLRSFIRDRNIVWAKADVERLNICYREHNRLASLRQTALHHIDIRRVRENDFTVEVLMMSECKNCELKIDNDAGWQGHVHKADGTTDDFPMCSEKCLNEWILEDDDDG